jgi:hypothetical protein
MEDTIFETVESNIVQEPEVEAQPDATQPDDTALETQLTEAIRTLWDKHLSFSADRKATSKELSQIRIDLAEKLAAMKSLLARPGRGGQWHSWLRERGIPRSSADRWVLRHSESLDTQKEIAPSGAIFKPVTDCAGSRLAKHLWPQIMTFLTKEDSVLQFIGGIARVSGINFQWRARGLMIFYPVPKAADEVPGSAAAPDMASQPTDVASGNTEEPAVETATAAPVPEAVAGVAEDVVGEVLVSGVGS